MNTFAGNVASAGNGIVTTATLDLSAKNPPVTGALVSPASFYALSCAGAGVAVTLPKASDVPVGTTIDFAVGTAFASTFVPAAGDTVNGGAAPVSSLATVGSQARAIALSATGWGVATSIRAL